MKNSKSKSNLNKMVRVRVPKDYPWKLLDRMVDDLRCSLTEDSFNHVKTIARERDYEKYMELSETWGPQSISPSGTSVDEFFARYQASSLLKKFQFKTDKQLRRSAALEKFKAAELNCAAFNQYGWKNIALPESEEALSVFTHARNFLEKLLGSELPPRDKLTLWSRHGPGSNLDTKLRRISLYDKYKSWPYSCTRGALALAREAIQDDERWLGALESDYREKHGIEPWRILDQEVFWSNVLKVVPGNRITFVPKNGRTDRSIAIEPCMNLYLQLGVDGFIRRRLKRYGVDLDDQSKNQELARLGSKLWTTEDPFVTLDLAAASDSISLELVRQLLPPQWYTYLIRLRSPVGVCDGEVFEYEKISSMGNGYTFALESAIFTSVIYGVEKTLKGRFDRDECAIYGDDLIVRRSSSLMVVQMLNLCGFSLNLEKSFISGPFRESCGADWFSGTSVRPVFLTDQPSTVMELWCDLNRIRRILSLRFWGFEFEVTKLIEKWIPPQFNDCVGPLSDESFDSYKHVLAPVNRYKNGLWLFRRLVAIPKRLKGDNFLFRKLMHTLRMSEHVRPSYTLQRFGGLAISDAGSRFTITKPSLVTVCYSSSPASCWQDEYNDLLVLKTH
jgi:hypothetical protein